MKATVPTSHKERLLFIPAKPLVPDPMNQKDSHICTSDLIFLNNVLLERMRAEEVLWQVCSQ